MVENERSTERTTFVIVKPSSSFMERNEIEAQRLDGTDAVTVLIASQPDKETKSGEPEFLTIGTTREQLLKSAKDALEGPNSNIARKCFKSLALIVPEAKTTSDVVDEATGIRIIEIKKGAPRFPTHPTPNS